MHPGRATLAVLLVSLLPVSAPAAQESDARVAPPGVLRFQVGGQFSSIQATFGEPGGAGGERLALRTPFATTLTSAEFAPLQFLESELNAVFQADDGEPLANPTNLFLSTESLQARADHRRVPLSLEVGLLPRISLAVMLPLTQQWVEVHRFGVSGGTVGLNPNPVQNRALLVAVDSGFAALGEGALLPLADSELGRALQARIRVATDGQELLLPQEPALQVGFAGLLQPPPLQLTRRHVAGQPAWGQGDVEVMLRLQLLDTPGPLTALTGDGPGYRAAVELGARLPTGTPASADYLVLPPTDENLGGLLVGLHNDLIASPRLRASASLRWERLGGADLPIRRWEFGEAFPPAAVDDTLRWEAGDRLTLDLLPRIHLLDEIAFVGRYAYQRRSGESFARAGEDVVGATRSGQRWGLGMEYSTARAYREGRARVPFEASLLYRETFSGSGGEPADRGFELYGRLFLRAWGRR